jgi:hypothetical protein
MEHDADAARSVLLAVCHSKRHFQLLDNELFLYKWQQGIMWELSPWYQQLVFSCFYRFKQNYLLMLLQRQCIGVDIVVEVEKIYS